MATLAIGLAGAAIGAPFGLGSVGFIAGSVIGNLLFPGDDEVVRGPRLGDTSVSASTYGLPIPLAYGTVRLGGNMIWSTGIVERENRETVGGKGGLGGPQQTQITYTYFASFAISFAGREAREVTRIWANGKLIFDKTSTRFVRKQGLRFRFYPGDEEQLPDSLIEADRGVGQVPAHRGTCYIVFDNLQLTDYGNRHPNITAEIAFAATNANSAVGSTDLTPNQSYDNNALMADRARRRIYIETGNLRVFNYDTLVEFRRPTVPTTPLVASNWEAGRFSGNLYSSGGGNGSPVFKISPNTFAELARFGTDSLSTSNTTTRFGTSKWLVEGQTFTFVAGTRNLLFQIAQFNDIGLLDADTMEYIWHLDNGALQVSAVGGANTLYRQQEGTCVFWFLNQIGSGNDPLYIYKLEVLSGARYDASLQVTFGVTLTLAATIPASTWNSIGTSRVAGPAIDQADDGLILALTVTGGCQIFKWIEGEGVVWSTFVAGQAAPGGASWVKNSTIVDGRVGWIDRVNTASIIDTSNGDLIVTESNIQTPLGVDLALGSMFWDGESEQIVMHNVGSLAGDVVRLSVDRATGEGESLSSIVQDLSGRVDLAASDLDVTALTDTVSGYTVARQMTAREAIEPLAQTYLFDGVESDDVVKFVKRGGAAALTIPQADLIDLDERGRVVSEERTQEVDLPERLSVVYVDRSTDYQQGTESFKRTRQPTPVVRSRREETLRLPIVLTATEAKRTAERLLVSAWNERSGRRFRTAQRYLALEPTDVINIQLDSGTILPVRISQATVGEDFTIEFEGVNEASQTFLSDAVSQNPLGVPAKDLPPSPFNQLFQFNIPLLRDVDDTGGSSSRLYYGLGGFDARFNGGYLLQSLDGGSSYDQVSKALAGLPWGVISNRLPATTTPFQTDTTTTLTVFMQVGELQSVTDAQLLANANAAIVGSPTTNVWEVILYRDAVETVAGVYSVSTIVRARRGTDPFVDNHADGEFFIPLSTDSLFSYLLEIGRLNSALPYKAIGFAQVQEEVPAETFTALGRDLQPYAPAQLGAQVVSADIQIDWTRRTRTGGELRDGTGLVPLGEASEAYEIDIKDGPAGTVLRTVTGLVSPSYTYVNADIVTDFGSVPTALTFEVFQISAAVGRGFGAERTEAFAPVPIDVQIAALAPSFVYRPTVENTYTDLGVTPVTTNGDLVRQTDDLSANGNDATQSTVSDRPGWIAPIGLNFDGANDHLQTGFSGSATSGTLLARVRVDTTSTATDAILGNTSGVNRRWISFTNGIVSMGIGALGSDIFQDTGAVDRRSSTTFVTVAGVYDNGNCEIFVDGVSVASSTYTGTVNTNAMYIGARNVNGFDDLNLVGDIKAAMAIQAALSPSQIQDIHNFWSTL